MSEDEMVNIYVKAEKKRCLHFAKLEETASGVKCLLKQIVRRVTIEGEHSYLLLVKGTDTAVSMLELVPIVNAPHQTEVIKIYPGDIKFALSYSYMF